MEKSSLKLNIEEKEGLRLTINIIYHIKNKDPFTKYPKLLTLQKKNKAIALQKSKQACSYATDDYGADFIWKVAMNFLKDDLLKTSYYFMVCDRSTDNSIIEQETIYVLFLHDGAPKLWYFSIENVENANAAVVLSSINTAFERIGIMNFEINFLA